MDDMEQQNHLSIYGKKKLLDPKCIASPFALKPKHMTFVGTFSLILESTNKAYEDQKYL
jgi:hypothetical protein